MGEMFWAIATIPIIFVITVLVELLFQWLSSNGSKRANHSDTGGNLLSMIRLILIALVVATAVVLLFYELGLLDSL